MMKFQTWGKRPIVTFEIKTGLDGNLHAVFASEDDATFAWMIGMFRNCPRACFGGYDNAFQIEV